MLRRKVNVSFRSNLLHKTSVFNTITKPVTINKTVCPFLFIKQRIHVYNEIQTQQHQKPFFVLSKSLYSSILKPYASTRGIFANTFIKYSKNFANNASGFDINSNNKGAADLKSKTVVDKGANSGEKNSFRMQQKLYDIAYIPANVTSFQELKVVGKNNNYGNLMDKALGGSDRNLKIYLDKFVSEVTEKDEPIKNGISEPWVDKLYDIAMKFNAIEKLESMGITTLSYWKKYRLDLTLNIDQIAGKVLTIIFDEAVENMCIWYDLCNEWKDQFQNNDGFDFPQLTSEPLKILVFPEYCGDKNKENVNILATNNGIEKTGKKSNDRLKNPVYAIAGASRTGKSRMLDEITKLVHINGGLCIPTSFNNETSLAKKTKIKTIADFKVEVFSRLVHALVCGKSEKKIINFDEIYKYTFWGVLDFRDIVELAENLGYKVKNFVLIFDEFSKLLDLIEDIPDEERKKYLSSITNCYNSGAYMIVSGFTKGFVKSFGSISGRETKSYYISPINSLTRTEFIPLSIAFACSLKATLKSRLMLLFNSVSAHQFCIYNSSIYWYCHRQAGLLPYIIDNNINKNGSFLELNKIELNNIFDSSIGVFEEISQNSNKFKVAIEDYMKNVIEGTLNEHFERKDFLNIEKLSIALHRKKNGEKNIEPRLNPIYYFAVMSGSKNAYKEKPIINLIRKFCLETDNELLNNIDKKIKYDSKKSFLFAIKKCVFNSLKENINFKHFINILFDSYYNIENDFKTFVDKSVCLTFNIQKNDLNINNKRSDEMDDYDLVYEMKNSFPKDFDEKEIKCPIIYSKNMFNNSCDLALQGKLTYKTNGNIKSEIADEKILILFSYCANGIPNDEEETNVSKERNIGNFKDVLEKIIGVITENEKKLSSFTRIMFVYFTNLDPKEFYKNVTEILNCSKNNPKEFYINDTKIINNSKNNKLSFHIMNYGKTINGYTYEDFPRNDTIMAINKMKGAILEELLCEALTNRVMYCSKKGFELSLSMFDKSINFNFPDGATVRFPKKTAIEEHNVNRDMEYFPHNWDGTPLRHSIIKPTNPSNPGCDVVLFGELVYKIKNVTKTEEILFLFETKYWKLNRRDKNPIDELVRKFKIILKEIENPINKFNLLKIFNIKNPSIATKFKKIAFIFFITKNFYTEISTKDEENFKSINEIIKEKKLEACLSCHIVEAPYDKKDGSDAFHKWMMDSMHYMLPDFELPGDYEK